MNRRALVTATVSVVLVAITSGLAFIAGREISRPTDTPSASGPAIYLVKQGVVERTQDFAAQAEWPSVRSIAVPVSGTVTHVNVGGADLLEAGSALFSINQSPAYLAEGAVPAFRTMSPGDSGEDILQLTRFLVDQGHLMRPTAEFDTSVRSAVVSWHQATGSGADASVALGSIYFVPDLPARLALGESLQVGSVIQGGATSFSVLDDAPTFSILLDSGQRNLVPLDAEVEVTSEERVWTGRISGARERAGVLALDLVADDGGPLCSDACNTVPVGVATDFPVKVTLTPTTEGPLVPIAALRTEPSGATTVQAVDGRRIEVDVIASADGLAIVEGLQPGTEIVLVVDDP